ncbi:MAG TPA: hypothetical protein VJN95_06095 [Gemmatimonadales bacterium]|nr:hypothetical protein [Gemmatimonadales bacterium]
MIRLLKNTLALVGLGLAVVAERLDSKPLVWVAIGCLAAAFTLRFLARRQD